MIEIIAEVGVNHDGSLTNALLLADEARAAGANVVKFQMFDAALLGRPELKRYELSGSDLKALKDACEDMGVEFLCTPFDVQAVRWLASIGVKRMKVSSGCLRRPKLLDAVRETGLPVILSTGMSTPGDVELALNILDQEDVTLLHCVSAYPCPAEDANLSAIEELNMYGQAVGYSDHTKGITAAIAAAALGATIIEKHLTLDCRAEGPDHAASIEPPEFAQMVKAIREVEIMLGDGVKRIMPSERATRALWP